MMGSREKGKVFEEFFQYMSVEEMMELRSRSQDMLGYVNKICSVVTGGINN